jgi:MurNAc alpha-1-phosphate uridylyltransferase
VRASRGLPLPGLSVLHPQLFTGLSEGKRALAPLLREAIAAGTTGEYFAGPWVDVGTPERLTELDQKIRAGI